VKPQYGLTDEEVERMLIESLEHASGDMQQRALVEAQTEARVLISTTQNFLDKNAAYLTGTELNDTRKAMSELEDLLAGSNDKDKIHKAIETLNEISRPYAERVMDEAISKAMKGKSIQ
jgi:molecular chaperone HscA